MKNLAEELKAVVKEVQWYKYWGKKKELENMNKEKNDRRNKLPFFFHDFGMVIHEYFIILIFIF